MSTNEFIHLSYQVAHIHQEIVPSRECADSKKETPLSSVPPKTPVVAETLVPKNVSSDLWHLIAQPDFYDTARRKKKEKKSDSLSIMTWQYSPPTPRVASCHEVYKKRFWRPTVSTRNPSFSMPPMSRTPRPSKTHLGIFMW